MGIINFIWSEDDVTKAAKMWADGLSSTAIGRHFKVSRSAVLGLAHRNRDRFPQRAPLNSKTMDPIRRRAAVMQRQRQKAAAKPASDRKAKIAKPAKMVIVPQFVEEAQTSQRYDLSKFQLAGTASIAFVDLGHNQCRFPFECMETRSGPATPCCGARTEELQSYCEAHRLVMSGGFC
ncbi:GcrA family cell cycle regulator [Neorhizobium sp. Rsf11]|uniref:GcrA family cell cycle regulator n=1 Tax=Neorhizobium phenanthreniclasticum TaxID=3157917 RepID=A0ABV0LW83_9HYPH